MVRRVQQRRGPRRELDAAPLRAHPLASRDLAAIYIIGGQGERLHWQSQIVSHLRADSATADVAVESHGCSRAARPPRAAGCDVSRPPPRPSICPAQRRLADQSRLPTRVLNETCTAEAIFRATHSVVCSWWNAYRRRPVYGGAPRVSTERHPNRPHSRSLTIRSACPAVLVAHLDVNSFEHANGYATPP